MFQMLPALPPARKKMKITLDDIIKREYEVIVWCNFLGGSMTFSGVIKEVNRKYDYIVVLDTFLNKQSTLPACDISKIEVFLRG